MPPSDARENRAAGQSTKRTTKSKKFGTNLPYCLKIHKFPIDKRSGSGYDDTIRKYGNAM